MGRCRLWFDVGIKRYTTQKLEVYQRFVLWFDVGIKRYTTSVGSRPSNWSCGLM